MPTPNHASNEATDMSSINHGLIKLLWRSDALVSDGGISCYYLKKLPSTHHFLKRFSQKFCYTPSFPVVLCAMSRSNHFTNLGIPTIQQSFDQSPCPQSFQAILPDRCNPSWKIHSCQHHWHILWKGCSLASMADGTHFCSPICSQKCTTKFTP